MCLRKLLDSFSKAALTVVRPKEKLGGFER